MIRVKISTGKRVYINMKSKIFSPFPFAPLGVAGAFSDFFSFLAGGGGAAGVPRSDERVRRLPSISSPVPPRL